MLPPATALLPLLIVLPWLAYRARHRPFDLRLAAAMTLATYLAVLVGLTFFPFPLPPYPADAAPLDLNLRPFRTIGPALNLGPGSQQFRLLVGNLIAFVPLGMLIPAVRPSRHGWPLVATIGLGATVAIEVGQLLVSAAIGVGYRSADIDDVTVNFVGALTGYGLVRLAVRWRN